MTQDPGLYLSYLYPHYQIQFITYSRCSTLQLEATEKSRSVKHSGDVKCDFSNLM